MPSCGCEETFYYFQRSFHFSHSELKACDHISEPGHLPPLPILCTIGSEDDEFEKHIPEDMAEAILDSIARRKKNAEERIAELKSERRKLYQQDYQKNRRFKDTEDRRAYNRAWRAKNVDKRRAYERNWRDTHVAERKAIDQRFTKKRKLTQLRKQKKQLEDQLAAARAARGSDDEPNQGDADDSNREDVHSEDPNEEDSDDEHPDGKDSDDEGSDGEAPLPRKLDEDTSGDDSSSTASSEF